MTAPFTGDTDAKLRYFFKDDEAAIALAYHLFYLTHFWDDLVDGDVARTPAEVEKALRLQWVDLQWNPFYIVHAPMLIPMLSRLTLLWLDSNKLENGDDNDKFIAYHIRCDLVNVIHIMIAMKGGPDWAAEVGVDFWRTFGPDLADYRQFLAEKAPKTSLSLVGKGE